MADSGLNSAVMDTLFETNSAQCSIPYKNQAWFGKQTNNCFYVQKNPLKYNNATPFILNNYLLKCAQRTLNVYFAENLSILHKHL